MDDRFKDTEIVYIDGYYDGPLSGVCIYRGKLCYFKIQSGDEFADVREYDVFDIDEMLETAKPIGAISSMDKCWADGCGR